jgi:glycosyltransferase involved in cell wall biosynthesis
MSSSLRILQVSPQDIDGGAERIAWNLFQGMRTRGLPSWLAVGRKLSTDPNVLVIPSRDPSQSTWNRFWSNLEIWLRSRAVPGLRQLTRVVRWLAAPGYRLENYLGIEDFRFPGSWELLTLPPRPPTLIHGHNLHGGYFDLRVLAWLSRRLPVVLTLHDAWLLSGHCSHSHGCLRWQTGCGRCPDLTLYPAIRRDATAYNWRRKRRIYRRSRLFVATPCRWLMDKVERSMLADGIVEKRVIPNGIDLNVFRPADRMEMRAKLGLPSAAKILLFAANKWIRESRHKDYPTMRAAVACAAERLPGEQVLLLALGEDRPKEFVGRAEVRFLPFQKDPAVVASYYQAADAYIHAAKVDTFPTTILEGLACGTPVIATAVCGIPEQIKSLNDLSAIDELGGHYDRSEATGVLVPAEDGGPKMSEAILCLLTDRALREQLGANAYRDARSRFGMDLQLDRYLEWYQELIFHSARLPGTREPICERTASFTSHGMN